MIVGIGTDIAHVVRFEQALARWGESFARRVLDDSELEIYRDASRPAHLLAKHFAAKEAVAKALGTGFRQGVALRQIGVTRDAAGKPLLYFSGRTAELLTAAGVNNAQLSLADEAEYALAFVVLSRD
jgi:holo-[acyl-carrier protein] synthase